MSRKNDAWGIEVGSNAIKAVNLIREGNDVYLNDYDVIPFKKVLTTPDLNVDEAVQVGLDEFLSRHSVARSTVLVSAPGNIRAFARFAQLPPVDPKRINAIVNFEAQQQIPFPLDQVEWDYQVFQQEDSPDVSVCIVAIPKERIGQFLSNYHAVRMRVDGVNLSPLAVYNAFAYDMDINADTPGFILMDIGTTCTDVIIVEKGKIWLRTLAIGGNNFTDALVRSFKLSFPKAERLKREASTSKYARQVFQAMRPVFSDLVQEMQRSLGFYQSLNREAKITKLIGVGSTFRLPGMQKFLKQQLQMEVIRSDGFKRISAEGKQEADFADNAINLATAYGLALQGLGLERVDTNVLPRHVIKQRVWKAKQPWMIGAAALVVASSAASYVKLESDKKLYADEMAPANDKAMSVKKKAQGFVAEWNTLQGKNDPRQQIENLRRILDYRDVWPRILQDVSEAAMSLSPQRETLASDYKALADAKIATHMRRRIYISELNAKYVFGTATAGAAEAAPPQRGMSLDDLFGTRDEARVDPAAAAAKRVPGAKKPEKDANAPVRNPPSFKITVSGFTAFKEGPRLLGDNLVKWLNENTDRRDRPYKIVLLDNTLTGFALVKPGGGQTTPGSNTPAGRRTDEAAGLTAPPVSRGGIRGGAPAPAPTPMNPMGGEVSAAPTAAAAAVVTTNEALFRPEDGDITRQGGWRFTLEWTVQLIRPDDARTAEEFDAPVGDAAAPATPASIDAPAAPAAPPVSNSNVDKKEGTL